MIVIAVGMKICLWMVEYTLTDIRVLKEVIVTVTEIRHKVPFEFSGLSSSELSVRAQDDEGEIYEKHWNVWPENREQDALHTWSLRCDEDLSWHPIEAISVYNNNASKGFDLMSMRIVDQSGQEIKPKGDVEYCESDDQYSHQGNTCFLCSFKPILTVVEK